MTYFSLENITLFTPIIANCVMVAFTSRESVLLSILVSGIEKGSKGGILSLGMPKKKKKQSNKTIF